MNVYSGIIHNSQKNRNKLNEHQKMMNGKTHDIYLIQYMYIQYLYIGILFNN